MFFVLIVALEYKQGRCVWAGHMRQHVVTFHVVHVIAFRLPVVYLGPHQSCKTAIRARAVLCSPKIIFPNFPEKPLRRAREMTQKLRSSPYKIV